MASYSIFNQTAGSEHRYVQQSPVKTYIDTSLIDHNYRNRATKYINLNLTYRRPEKDEFTETTFVAPLE